MSDGLAREEDQILRWIEGSPPAFEVVKEGRVLALGEAAWQAATQRLEPGAGESYGQLARSGQFGPWWPSAVGGQLPGIRRFRLQLPSEVWRRPWEGMIGALDPLRWGQVSIIRQTASDAAPIHPSKLESALTVLCIQGAPTLDDDTLDLEAELHALQTAYGALDFAAARAVAPPIAVKGRFHDLDAVLLKHFPTIIWFSGHARPDPPGLLLDDGHWLEPRELAGILRSAREKGGRTPLYAVLWACHTGSAPPFGKPSPAPAFVEALSAEGVAALLVSQAPLGDDVARRVAGEIFSALASGLPLDHGVTRARADLMRLAPDDETLLKGLDWMCPVVWSRGCPPPTLCWTDQREEWARRQGLARKLLPARLANLPEQPATLEPWPDVPRLWVTSAAPDAEEPRAQWARRVLALQRRTARTVLWLDFLAAPREPANAAFQLRDWAKRALDKVEADDDPTEALRTAATQMERDHKGAWCALCSNDWFLLAIMGPPDQSEEWLWKGLREGKARAIVLAADYPDERVEEWKVDALMVHGESIEKSKVLAALAVLGCPAARSDIEDAAGEAVGGWIERGVIVETSAGCAMPAAVVEKVIMALTPEECVEGHGLAYDFLSGKVAKRKLEERDREDILLARWRHAQLAKWTKGIHMDGENLLLLYHRQNRSAALLSILSFLVSSDWYPPSDVVVAIAWAFLADGNPESAVAWLESWPEEDSAEWLVVRAEAEKSSGAPDSKGKARAYLERALAMLDGIAGERKAARRLRVRHDIARLVHFFDREPEAAIILYEAIEREWEGIVYSDLDRAITIRNLAEALMDSDRAADAETRAQQARRLLPPWTQHIAVSEVEYLRGRIAIRLGLEEEEILARFEECRKRALATNYMMLVAIVEARMFWRQLEQQSAELFDDAGWAERAKKLTLFARHAWVARVLIKGRLCAARRLGERGERGRARSELADAQHLVDMNPAFDQGSDRQRNATLHAGLTIYESNGGKRWEAWRQRYAWSNEFPDDPQEVWKLVC
jgi:hypothetical protein